MISRFFLWQRFSSFWILSHFFEPQTDDDMWLEREKSRNHALIAIIISYEWGGNFVSAFWSFTYVCGESSGGWMRWNKRGRKRRKRRILLLTLKCFINSIRWKRLIIVNFNFSLPFDPFFLSISLQNHWFYWGLRSIRLRSWKFSFYWFKDFSPLQCGKRVPLEGLFEVYHCATVVVCAWAWSHRRISWWRYSNVILIWFRMPVNNPDTQHERGIWCLCLRTLFLFFSFPFGRAALV